MKVSKGSVFKRKDSQFLYLNLSVNGKRYVQKTRYTEKELSRVKNEVLPLVRAKILSGEIVVEKEESVKTFEHYSKIFLDTKVLKPSTLSSYKNTINRLNKIFGKKKINEIKPSQIKTVLFNFNVGSLRFKHFLQICKGIFEEAILDEVIEKNPCDKIKAPKETSQREIFPFEQHEVVTILENSIGWFRNFLAAAFYSGARSGELYALKWQNIDLKRKRIYIDSSRGDYVEGSTKTNKSRYIPIFDNLVPYLQDQKKITGLKTYVFLTDHGKNLSPSNILKYHWKPLLKRLNFPYRKIYSTRHTFATSMINSGKLSLNQIASILGHANIQMLIKHYNKYIENETDKIDTNIDPFCNGFCNDMSKSA